MPRSVTQGPPRRRSVKPAERRRQLVDAALSVFAVKGVPGTSVDDIVKAAGVAKGTFYLYFSTKDEIVDEVAKRMVQGVTDRIEVLAADRHRSAVERLVQFGQSLETVTGTDHERELIEVFHRPENRAIHDRLGEQMIRQLRPTMVAIVADGIAQGHLRRQDPERAATFALACFGVLHDVVAAPSDLERAVRDLHGFILRGLGYEGEMPR